MEARSPQGLDTERNPLVMASALGLVLLVLAAAIARDLSIAATSPAAVGADPSMGDDGALGSLALVGLLVAGAGLIAIPRLYAPAWSLALLNGAAVAFVLSQDLTYDVYGDTARRYIAVGAVGPAWIASLAVLAFMATLIGWLFPRAGTFVNGLFLWLCALVAALATFVLH